MHFSLMAAITVFGAGVSLLKIAFMKRPRLGFERSRGDDAAERGAPSSETDGYSTKLLLNRPLNG